MQKDLEQFNRWAPSAKTGIGKSINGASNVTFTLGQGGLNEIYFPQEDTPYIRHARFIVTGPNFFSDEIQDTDHFQEVIEENTFAYRITNTCKFNKYVLQKEIVVDPLRNTLLQKISFKPAEDNLHLYLFIIPAVVNSQLSHAFIEDYKGMKLICSVFDETVLAVACSEGWLNTHVGLLGISDGWKDLKEKKQLTTFCEKADFGNLTLMGELNVQACKEQVLAIGMGHTIDEAAHHACSSLLDGFDKSKDKYILEWKDWQKCNMNQYRTKDKNQLFTQSFGVLHICESKRYAGAIIASPTIPWGNENNDPSTGGYHLVWPRDLVETSGAFLAIHSKENSLRILNYLLSIQENDGKWNQNTWLNGKPYSTGKQMDECALPVILAYGCYKEGYLDKTLLENYISKLKKALLYLIHKGPYTQEGRWEEPHRGYSPYTFATEIAALILGAKLVEAYDLESLAQNCLAHADKWNRDLDHFCYVTDTQLSQKVGVEGYYVRSNPKNIKASDLKNEYMELKHYAGSIKNVCLAELVSTDALELVRFGLRSPHDPRILNTIKVIDETLKVETPFGPGWHRFTYDGYGERPDGSGYKEKGIGRLWPLLTGERAHYEIAAGNFEYAEKLLQTMEKFSENGLFSEQVWDVEDIPEKNLYLGRPTGSAMPLLWAHAEYIKLVLSLEAKKVIDMPDEVQKRYWHCK